MATDPMHGGAHPPNAPRPPRSTRRPQPPPRPPMATDRVLTAAEVAKAVSGFGITDTGDDMAVLAASHEQLRADLAAMTAVARRFRDGCEPWRGIWVRNDGAGRGLDMGPVTDAEVAALDALDAGDA